MKFSSSRRGALAVALALTVVCGLAPQTGARAGAAEPIKVGVLKFGTVSWEIDVIKSQKLDEANGVAVQPVDLASNDSARIAFQAGEVDTIVSDVMWAARLRAEGRPVVYIPFSATEGSIMVDGDAPMKSVADLKGKKIGVAGGPLDKGWLLLQAYAKKTAGLDLAKEAEPVYGAPPLLQQKLEAKELDAALIYWNFAARLEAKGFRELISVEDAAKALGSSGKVAMIGYVFQQSFADAHPEAIKGFVRASRAAKQVLASTPAEWDRIRPLMRADDDGTFQALKRRFLAGVPTRAAAEEETDAGRLYDLIAAAGGEKLVGPAKTLPAGTYWPGLKNGS